VLEQALLSGLKQEREETPSQGWQEFLNSITRAAQSRLLDDCQRDTLERAAGELVPVLAAA
jgi:hypothetical protein